MNAVRDNDRSTEPITTVIRPEPLTLSSQLDVFVPPRQKPMPRPLPTFPPLRGSDFGPVQAGWFFTLSRTEVRPMLLNARSLGPRSPASGAFFTLKSTLSIPSFSATSSITLSTANVIGGPPGALYACTLGRLVTTSYPMMRRFGVLYGLKPTSVPPASGEPGKLPAL